MPTSIERFHEEELKLSIKRDLVISKAMSSGNVDEILKASQYIQKREQTDSKSILIDPQQVSTGFGYKEKENSLSYQFLKGMGRTQIPKSIIETRKKQVTAFCTPQQDKYSSGFIIEKKSRYSVTKKVVKLTKQEEQRIEDIIEFLLNCGSSENFWHGDSFDVFVSKILDDSLIYDQATAEIVRNKAGQIVEFFATDGATFRVADSYDDDMKSGKEIEEKGYTPSHVQVYQNNILAEFYPWEMMFGVRNPDTDIRSNGYGRAELEDMVQTVTALLNSDLYNANFFKVGSAPKGILRYSGNINVNTVEELKKQWQAQVAGVNNAHKMPMINADKLDFINTHVPNKDMEYSKYQEFLIKISCALYTIDPAEIGFPMSGSSDSKPMFEGNNESRLKYSRDKGLKPLLKNIEAWINKWLMSQLDKSFTFRFVGIENEKNENDDLEQDIKRLSNFMTLNEIRAKYNLAPIKGGDMVLNSVYNQALQSAAQMDMQKQQMGMQQGMGEGDQNMEQEYEDEDEDNPFMKALSLELPELLNKPIDVN